MEPTIYKPSIYNGAGIYKTGNNGGGGGGVVIPDEYFELEYLEISRDVGGANFIINVNPFSNKDRTFSVIAELNEYYEAYQKDIIKASARASLSDPGFLFEYMFISSNDIRLISRNNNSDYYTPIYSRANQIKNKVKLSIKNSLFTIEDYQGNIVETSTNYGESTFTNIFIFTDRTNPGEYKQAYGKFYQIEIEGVINLVPVKRKLDNVIGFFDKVSKIFITANYGQNNLIAGPIKM